MDWKLERKIFCLVVIVFLACFFMPIGQERFDGAILEAFHLLQWYAREHVLLCLIPAFFIAGAISVFVSQASVMKYLGAKAHKVLAYSVASVSGAILAVCSCTVLPLFAGIYKMGAGLGPAVTFLYAGPAVNVLAIILTARVLGLQIGAARAMGAIVFSILIGLIMHLVFRKGELKKESPQMVTMEAGRPLWKDALYFASMIGVLVFANFGHSQEPQGLWARIYALKWVLTTGFSLAFFLILFLWFKVNGLHLILAVIPAAGIWLIFPHNPLFVFSAGLLGFSVVLFFDRNEGEQWLFASWGYAKQMLPLLFFGVLIAGALLGRPDHEGLIPAQWVSRAVGSETLYSNLFASVAGAFMYFATLTEIPILQGLIGAGMGKGPALALLLAGPALSLPNMLVIRSVMGTKKTAAYVFLVCVMATISGMIYGRLF